MSVPSTTSVKLDADMKDRVRRLAERRRRSAHWVMREAISQYVEREEERASIRDDAIAAWEEYQATGLHLTFEEVDAWMAKIEAGEDAELPECHS